MSKKLMSVTVRGDQHKWCFNFYCDPKYLNDWRSDGLEVYEIENTIPVWVNNLGMTKAWCFFQDILNLKNPWA